MVLVMGADDDRLRLSDGFDDGVELLAAADGLEGIDSKMASMPYRSGTQCSWIKVKCPSWREATRERWRLSERR